MATHKHWQIVAVVTGILLIALSFVWSSSGGKWTDEQARNYSEAAADLHRLTYEAAPVPDQARQSASPEASPKSQGERRPFVPADIGATPDPSTATPDRAAAALAAAKKRYEEARTQLDAARSQGSGAAGALRWIGVGLAVAGLVFWAQAVKARAAEAPT